MDKDLTKLITNEFESIINRSILSTKLTPSHRPFHDALLPKQVVRFSAFERSFSTSLGARTFETIAELILQHNPNVSNVERQKYTFITLNTSINTAISSYIQDLRDNKRAPLNITDAVQMINDVEKKGNLIQIRVISDIWWETNDGCESFVSIKTVKPNIDQTAVALSDCLHIMASLPNANAFFALPYNPYGEIQSSYNFTPPMKIMNLTSDPHVLIGKDFWDTIGGEGCYEKILSIAKTVGKKLNNFYPQI